MPDTEHITVSNTGFAFPVVEVLTGRGFITGKSGSGKSNTASVIVEELLSQGYPCMIIDTDGEYYGLKEEFELLHVGADDTCDLVVGPEHAEKLAELALEDRVPIILDVSGYLDADEASALIRETTRHLFDKEKKLQTPFLLVVEEIHEYLPEGPSLSDTGEALIRVAKRGRKRGCGILGISQRPADVKKDFITQASWLVWHRLTWDNDTKVVSRVAGSVAANQVQDLADGEALVMADWLTGDETYGDTPWAPVQFRRKRTYDAGATPGLGDAERPELKSISSSITEELEAISEKQRSRQDELERLRKKVETKDERIEELEDELSRARDLSSMAEQFRKALTSTAGGENADRIEAAIDEVREKKNEEIRALREDKKELERYLDEIEEERDTLQARVQELEEKATTAGHLQHIDQHWEEISEAFSRLADGLGMKGTGYRSTGGPTDEKLRERAQQLKAENDKLKRQLKKQQLKKRESKTSPSNGQGASADTASAISHDLDSVEDFLEHESVKAAISEAKAKEGISPRYVKGIIATLLQSEDAVTYQDVAGNLGLETTADISKAATALADVGVIEKRRIGNTMHVSLHLDGLEEIHRIADRRHRTEHLMENL